MKKEFKETHRGIPTTTKKINEKKAVTIINRYGQKSPSLPRIDDLKRWAGYPGLTGISRPIIKYIPSNTYYVEPFAGAAKVYQELIKIKPAKFSFYILNDTSRFVYEWLKQEFTDPLITKLDFTEVIEQYNFKHSFFLLDWPWYMSYYNQTFSSFNRKSVKEYDLEVLKILDNIKGDFIITTRKENKRMLSSGFNNYLLQSDYPVSGKLPKVLLTTNLRLEGLEVVSL